MTCQTCHWWLATEKRGDYSLCVWHTGAGKSSGVKVKGPVRTKPDFGCAQWEADKRAKPTGERA